jgi:hypothetical protein
VQAIAAAPSATTATSHATFDVGLAALASADGGQPDSFVAGSLQLVGLEDIRENLGARWEAIANRAREIAELELQQELDIADFYRPYDDTSYLVCFSNLEQPDADRKAREIASSIRAKLAQQFPDIARIDGVDHFVAAVTRTSLAGDDGGIADRLYGTLQHMKQEAEATARQVRATIIRDFQVQYSPIWHTAKQVVILNRCQLDMASGCGTLAQFQALADPLQLKRVLAELDLLLLTKSLESLHAMLRSRRGSGFVVPVTFRTVDDPITRGEYVHLVSLIPDTYRKYIILEVCSIPEAARAVQLHRMISLTRNLAKGIAVEFEVNDHRLPDFLVEGAWAASVNLSGANSMDPQLAVQLRRFAATAQATHTRTFAHGANSIGLALAALEAGINYVDGPAIHIPAKEPTAVSPLYPLRYSRAPAAGATRW